MTAASHPIRAAVERADWWREHLRNRCRSKPLLKTTRRVLASEISAMVAAHYDLTPAQICDPTRSKHIVLPRQVAMYLIRRFTQRSYPWIAERFGKLDHSTVAHACARVEGLLATDPDIRDDVEELARRIVNG